MKGLLSIAVGLAIALAAAPADAAPKAKAPAEKGPPACGALTFRPLPSGMPDGEQQAGLYKSRFSKLELIGEIKGGAVVDYHVTAGGKPLTALNAALPAEVANCAAVKKLPKPTQPAAACTGEHFRVLVTHAGNERLAVLYAEDNNSWRYCSAGSF